MIDKSRVLLDEFEDIEKTLFWKTYCAKTQARLDVVRGFLETTDATNKLQIYQGEIAGLKWAINLPEVLLKNAKSGTSQESA